MPHRYNKLISLTLCVLLLLEQTGFAQTVSLNLANYLNQAPKPAVSDTFRPLHLRYLSYDNLNQDFKLLLDKGDTPKSQLENKTYIEENTQTLLKYFFVGLALPNDKFWVNLRPDSPDNILDPDLEKTDIGRIFLEADLQLKKDTAQFTSPQTPEGKAYWDQLYKRAGELFGTENITIPTITRPWIVPGEIIIREAADNAYIYKATLKVMLEEDYLNTKPVPPTRWNGLVEYSFKDPRLRELNQYSTQLIKETIIPKLTYEVNTSKRYAPLRQVYYSLILAQWFKARYRSQRTEDRGQRTEKVNNYLKLIDSGNLANLTSSQPYDKQTYFKQYQKSFAEGEYNLTEPVYTSYSQSIRKYMSGGMALEAAYSSSAVVYSGKVIKNIYKYLIGPVSKVVNSIWGSGDKVKEKWLTKEEIQFIANAIEKKQDIDKKTISDVVYNLMIRGYLIDELGINNFPALFKERMILAIMESEQTDIMRANASLKLLDRLGGNEEDKKKFMMAVQNKRLWGSQADEDDQTKIKFIRDIPSSKKGVGGEIFYENFLNVVANTVTVGDNLTIDLLLSAFDDNAGFGSEALLILLNRLGEFIVPRLKQKLGDDFDIKLKVFAGVREAAIIRSGWRFTHMTGGKRLEKPYAIEEKAFFLLKQILKEKSISVDLNKNSTDEIVGMIDNSRYREVFVLENYDVSLKKIAEIIVRLSAKPYEIGFSVVQQVSKDKSILIISKGNKGDNEPLPGLLDGFTPWVNLNIHTHPPAKKYPDFWDYAKKRSSYDDTHFNWDVFNNLKNGYPKFYILLKSGIENGVFVLVEHEIVAPSSCKGSHEEIHGEIVSKDERNTRKKLIEVLKEAIVQRPLEKQPSVSSAVETKDSDIANLRKFVDDLTRKNQWANIYLKAAEESGIQVNINNSIYNLESARPSSMIGFAHNDVLIITNMKTQEKFVLKRLGVFSDEVEIHKKLFEQGIAVPAVFSLNDALNKKYILMDFLEGEEIADRLYSINSFSGKLIYLFGIFNENDTLDNFIKNIKAMDKAGVLHDDLGNFKNMLYVKNKIVFIDFHFAQKVETANNAMSLINSLNEWIFGARKEIKNRGQDNEYVEYVEKFIAFAESMITRLGASPAFNNKISDKGGIAFNALPIQTEAVVSSALGSFSGAKAFQGDLDTEWSQIQQVFNAGIRPSVQRISEYTAAAASSPLAEEKIDEVRGMLADMLRREEESEKLKSTEEALKQLLTQLESDKPARELQLASLKN